MLSRQMQEQESLKATPPRGRTVVSVKREDVESVMKSFGASFNFMDHDIGAEVKGVDTTKPLDPKLVGALEALMADAGFVLFRGQGTPQKENGVEGVYLTGDQQCQLSLSFGNGALHSTHGNHPECPNRDIFRLSNNADHGFNEVGPEWHNDGSFERNVFGHVVYHIVKAPAGPGQSGTTMAPLNGTYSAMLSTTSSRPPR